MRQRRAQSDDGAAALAHWRVEPWSDDAPGAQLLDDIEDEFAKFIVLPVGAGDALALWVLHA